MSKPPFDMPGHYWDSQKKRFFKNKPKSSSTNLPSSTQSTTASISTSSSKQKSRKSKSTKHDHKHLPIRRQSRSIASQLLNLRRAIHSSNFYSSSINSSLASTFKSQSIDRNMSNLKLTHKDTLPLQVGRHPISCFSDVLRDDDGRQDLSWLHVGDSSGALWQIPTSFSSNSRLLSLPILQPDENGNLYSSHHTSISSSAAYLTHNILNPPMSSIKSNQELIAFLDSKGFKIFSRSSNQRSRLEPFKMEDQIFKNDRFEIRCFEILQFRDSSGDHLVAIGGDHKVQLVLSSKGLEKFKVKSEIISTNQQIMSLAFLDQEHLLLGTRSGEIHLWKLSIESKGIKVIGKSKLEIRETDDLYESQDRTEILTKGKSKRRRTQEGKSRTSNDTVRSKGSVVHLQKVENGRIELHGIEIVVSWTSGEMYRLVLQSRSVASTTENHLQSYDLTIKTAFQGHSNSHFFDLGLALDSGNRILAVAGSDRKIRIWRLDSEEPLREQQSLMKLESKIGSELEKTSNNEEHRHRSGSIPELPMNSSLASITFSQPIKALRFLGRNGLRIELGLPMLAVGDGNQILYFQ